MSQPSPPSAPSAGQSFREGIQTWIKYLPKMLRIENQSRLKWDPKRLAEQQALQGRFGPTQYAQQLAAYRQLDPTGYALREALGGRISDILQRGYVDPRQAGVYNQLGASIQQALARGGLDPTQIAGYKALGTGVTGEYNRGYTMDPSLAREVGQALRSRQDADVTGNAPAMAEAVYRGARAQQLRQQRTGNLQNFLTLRSPMADALASATQYSQLQTPMEKALAQSGAFGSLPTSIQQIQGIQGVIPDRAFAYMNPNAGPQGQQFALTNYPNQYAGYNPTNPWMGALGGAASGAASGAMVGSMFPGYGTLIGAGVGALAGGVGGYFSDPKMKRDIKKVGNLPIYEYRYKPQFGIRGTFRGPMSTDVKKLDSGAVRRVFGHDFVTTPNRLGINRVKVKEE